MNGAPLEKISERLTVAPY